MTLKTNAVQVSDEITELSRGLHQSGVFSVNLVAQRVKKGIRDSILAKQKIDGRSRRRLRASTVKSKRKTSTTPSTPLRNKGVMLNVNITTATLAKPKSVITPAKSREKVGKRNFDVAAHHQGGELGPWFGTSPEADKDIAVINAEIGRTAIREFNK